MLKKFLKKGVLGRLRLSPLGAETPFCSFCSSCVHCPEHWVWTPSGGDGRGAAGQRGHGDRLLLTEGLPHVHCHRHHLW